MAFSSDKIQLFKNVLLSVWLLNHGTFTETVVRKDVHQSLYYTMLGTENINVTLLRDKSGRERMRIRL